MRSFVRRRCRDVRGQLRRSQHRQQQLRRLHDEMQRRRNLRDGKMRAELRSRNDAVCDRRRRTRLHEHAKQQRALRHVQQPMPARTSVPHGIVHDRMPAALPTVQRGWRPNLRGFEARYAKLRRLQQGVHTRSLVLVGRRRTGLVRARLFGRQHQVRRRVQRHDDRSIQLRHVLSRVRRRKPVLQLEVPMK